MGSDFVDFAGNESASSFAFNRRFVLSKRVLMDLVAISDMGLVLLSGLLIKYIYVQWYFSDDWLGPTASGHLTYLGAIALVIAILYAGLRWRGYYRSDSLESWTLERGLARLLFTVVFSFGFALFIVFLLKESTLYSRVWVLSWCISSYLVLLGNRIFWVSHFKKLSAKGYFRQRILILGAGHALENAREAVLSEHCHAVLVGVSDLGVSGEGRSAGALEAAVTHAVTRGQSGTIDEVIIALPVSEGSQLDAIVRRLKLLPLEIKVLLDLGTSNLRPIELGRIGSANVVSVQKKPISDWNIFLKTIEDYILASLAVIIFLPAMAVIAVLIKLDSKGPVLFRQRRHGWNHKVIEVLKFRTMTVLEDGETIAQASKADRRVTRVGRLLRRTSLDELPQLFNVLAGEMSLVGPRPHALAHNNHYSKLLENYASRHRVKPGLTGWAQVNGFRGEITDPELMEKRVEYDLEYIDTWSIWFDLKILFLTPLFGFISSKAY